MLKFSDLAEIMDGQILHLSQDQVISRLVIDSRQLIVHPETVFFAIKGPNHDGHQFLEQVLAQNVVNFIVEQTFTRIPPSLSKANVIAVKDSVLALQALAAYHRSKFTIPVLGITGSNAKTIIKEWLFQLLDDRKVVKSPKSYNSQVGVPLSVWQLNPAAELAIFEAGVSRSGEMEHLAAVIRPTFGMMTNIGTAHDAGFKNVRDKILEKCKLFENSKVIFYRRDHEPIHNEFSRLFSPDRLWSWSTSGNATINFRLAFRNDETLVCWNESDHQVALPFTDQASVENALHCLNFLLHQGYSVTEINRKMATLKNIPHRLALRQGINNCYLVDDTYNNDLAGLDIALEFLNQQPHGKGQTVILSDIRQAALSTEKLYQAVAEKIKSQDVDHFFGIGEDITQQKHLFPDGSKFFNSTTGFLEWLQGNPIENQLILVKGAREFAFEIIVKHLVRKQHGTILEINLDALVHNLNVFRKQLKPRTKLMVMVKAFAYGSGSHEVANLLQYHGVDYLGVAYADEGVELRNKGISIPIMVMNPSTADFDQLINYQLEPEIYSLELLKALIDFCGDKHGCPPIHIKIDTGMHRLGFSLDQIPNLLDLLTCYPIPVASVFSHLAAANLPEESDFTKKQFELFNQAAGQLGKKLGPGFIRHVLNTDGILQYPEYQMDMVRLGIGLYGIGSDQLRNIGVLKTTISQIRPISTGTTIGYDRKGKVSRDSKIAVITIGYADGYDRRFGNGNGKVLVAGKLAPVVGNVCMDMTMIDVTDCDAREGDQVIVFNDQLTVSQLSASIGTIPYELLTKISDRVKRVYFLE